MLGRTARRDRRSAALDAEEVHRPSLFPIAAAALLGFIAALAVIPPPACNVVQKSSIDATSVNVPSPAPVCDKRAVNASTRVDVHPALSPSWLAQAQMNEADAWGSTTLYDPWPGISRAHGWRRFSPSEARTCIERVGGVGFTGDSVTREMVNVLLRDLDACCVDNSVPHADQSVSVPVGRARVVFRFSKLFEHLAPNMARLFGDDRVRALVANVGFWELNPAQGGVGWADLITAESTRAADFFLKLQRDVLPTLPQSNATSPPVRLVWRSTTSTTPSKIADGRGPYLAVGRVNALNALTHDMVNVWNSNAARFDTTPWRWVDSLSLMPQHDTERTTSADGYHPTPESLRNILDAVLSELCGGEV